MVKSLLLMTFVVILILIYEKLNFIVSKAVKIFWTPAFWNKYFMIVIFIVQNRKFCHCSYKRKLLFMFLQLTLTPSKDERKTGSQCRFCLWSIVTCEFLVENVIVAHIPSTIKVVTVKFKIYCKKTIIVFKNFSLKSILLPNYNTRDDLNYNFFTNLSSICIGTKMMSIAFTYR